MVPTFKGAYILVIEGNNSTTITMEFYFVCMNHQLNYIPSEGERFNRFHAVGSLPCTNSVIAYPELSRSWKM